MPDFEIPTLNDSKVGISVATKKAQYRLPPEQAQAQQLALLIPLQPRPETVSTA